MAPSETRSVRDQRINGEWLIVGDHVSSLVISTGEDCTRPKSEAKQFNAAQIADSLGPESKNLQSQ
jgi:hypothetical protein